MNKTNKTIKGNIDEFGFMYIVTSVVNSENGQRIDGIKSIIDTGASFSLIQSALINEINLYPIRQTEYLHPQNGNTKSNVFNIGLIIGDTQINRFRISDFNEKDYPSGIIIGIDFLKYCELNFSGRDKTFELTIPESFV